MIIARLNNAADSIDDGHVLTAFQFSEKELGDAPTGDKGPSYSEMLQSLFAAIKKDIADAKNKKAAYIKQLKIHYKKIDGEIEKNTAELTKLEKEEKSKITTEGLHEGFSTSVVSEISVSDVSMLPLRNPLSFQQRIVNKNLKLSRSRFSILENQRRRKIN